MKRTILLTLSFLLSINVISQKLYFRASLGWGVGILEKGEYSKYVLDEDVKVRYNSKLSFSNFIANPQTGYFLEYKINNKSLVGIGRMAGIIEHRVKIINSDKYGYSYTKGNYGKLGGYYQYDLNKFSFQLGMFYARNTSYIPGYGSTFIFTTKDPMGGTKDSSFNGDYSIRHWGITSSFNVGYSIVNKLKNRERFSINILIDIGWYRLSGLYDYVYSDYKPLISSNSFSNGSQIKIYISKPILIYDFKKDKYKLLKNKNS